MKTPLLIALAACLSLAGCALFHRSPTWDLVVKSRSHYSGADATGPKDGYINHLHQVLSGAGVPHKIVTFQFHFHNAYREEAVQTATAILYSDDTTPRNPWWAMDEYHHVPVWLPNWTLDAQLEFFVGRPAEILSVKEYAGNGRPRNAQVAQKKRRTPSHAIAQTSKPHKHRSVFSSTTRSHSAKPRPAKPAPEPQADADPLTATTLTGHPTDSAEATFRSMHGTAYNPGSSVDQKKMDELKRYLLTRNKSVQLRTE